MVCMVNSTAYTTRAAENESVATLGHSSPGCMKKENVQDLGMHGTYLWTPEMQGALMSSTAYGSIITIIFAGYIADTYGPRHVCLCGLALYSIVTLLSPFLADTNYWVFLIARSIMGLAGVCLAPINKNRILGTLGVTCTLLWYLFATNKPDENRFVNKREIVYLQESIGSVQEGRKKDRFKDVPWRCMIFSPVTWAIIINRFAFSWAMNIMQMLLPSYFRDVLSLNMNDNGLFTALPFLAQLISKNICAISADRLRKSGKIAEIQPWSKFATANMHIPRIHPVLDFNPMKLAEDSEKSSNTDLESI
uniref:Uncharacterized protein n=1 Tax=Acrobeloides nanus TaxID=290746 RepID=A0A914CSH8_9BILA